MLPTLKAIEFHSILRGSTRPVLAICRDEQGQELELVLKPVGSLKRGSFSRAAEALGSMLAKDLEFPVAEPCLVEIAKPFADSIPDRILAQAFNRSLGLNFGCKKLPEGASTWPEQLTRALPSQFASLPTRIFAFDALIQNYDRQADNPNILSVNGVPTLYDHEMAFSSANAHSTPPSLDHLQFDSFFRHVFWYALENLPQELAALSVALAGITPEHLKKYRQALPQAWAKECDSIDRILRYIKWACEHRAAILEQIATRFA